MRRLALVAVAVVAAACARGRVVRSGMVDTDALRVIERRLEDVRGLRFTADVPARVLDDAQVRALLDAELDREFAPGDLERLGRAYATIGLLPPGTDLRQAFQELYSDQLAALYDPRTKTLALTAGGLRQETMGLWLVSLFTGRDLLGEVLLAHELTHALQDQHYGLPTTTPPITAAHGDRMLARRALLEGDASLASVAYLMPGPMDRAAVLRFTEQVAAIPEELRERHPEVPEVIRASLAFQYNAGSAFAAAAYLRGGWPAVDDAQRDPPVSTEQVLHPEKYFDVRDRPADVTLGGTDELERAGWTTILEDTFGELDVRVLAGRGYDPVRAAGIAAGWGGDRCRVLARGDALAVVWLTTWDTVDDAADFAGAVPALVADARVERRGAAVLVVVAPDAERVAARAWRRSRVSRAG